MNAVQLKLDVTAPPPRAKDHRVLLRTFKPSINDTVSGKLYPHTCPEFESNLYGHYDKRNKSLTVQKPFFANQNNNRNNDRFPSYSDREYSRLSKKSARNVPERGMKSGLEFSTTVGMDPLKSINRNIWPFDPSQELGSIPSSNFGDVSGQEFGKNEPIKFNAPGEQNGEIEIKTKGSKAVGAKYENAITPMSISLMKNMNSSNNDGMNMLNIQRVFEKATQNHYHVHNNTPTVGGGGNAPQPPAAVPVTNS